MTRHISTLIPFIMCVHRTELLSFWWHFVPIWTTCGAANDKKCQNGNICVLMFGKILIVCYYCSGIGCNCHLSSNDSLLSWWRNQMETFSALLALCEGNSPVTGEFPSQRPVTRSLDVFFDLRLNKGLSKQSWGWWFETSSRSLWRHCNVSHQLVVPYWRHIAISILTSIG